MRLFTLALCLALAGDARAQVLPTEPISVANGRFVFGGELFATYGGEDPGWFNYTDYEYSGLRNFRAALSTEVRASRRLQLLAELRLDHGTHLSAYAMFLRVRPWPGRRFDVQIGRVPPTFGAFNRSVYAYDNLVIGQPLAYQYLLSIRPDAVPHGVNDLVRMRARGWLSEFPVGEPGGAPGVPIVNTGRFDTGVQVHGVAGAVEWIGAVTAGSLSDPRLTDNNGRPQLAGRLVATAQPGIRAGISVSRGAWLDGALDGVLPAGRRSRDYHQSAVAADVELSHGAWIARAEWLRSSWEMPAVSAEAPRAPLVARSLIVEGRYRLWPGLSLAARTDALWFSPLDVAGREVNWEANVWRFEAALQAAITRNIAAKVAWQRNRRDAGRVAHDSLVAAQLLYWF